MSSPTATDIISYIGIPLAVLGVLPIFYTFIRSVLTLQSVRRALRHNALEAVTRGSIMSGIVEVEIPRASLTPLERDEVGYWSLNPNPSSLKGGSWTLFNWNRIVTSRRLYRLAYSEDLQLPQAEVDFEELMTFLLDRGAVPNAKGIRMLRLAGLWTPVGTGILQSPDGSETALRISLPDDSDGVLSLALNWHPSWDQRGRISLPSSWMRLTNHVGPALEEAMLEQQESTNDEKKPLEVTEDEDIELADIKSKPQITNDKVKAQKASPPPSTSMRIHMSSRASVPIIDAVQHESASEQLAVSSIHVPIEHLQVSPTSTWVPAILVALGQHRSSNLWALEVPRDLTTLAGESTLPCGVLVEVGLVDEVDTPTWATTYDPREASLAVGIKMMRSQQRAMAEGLLPPAQRAAARTLREAEERNGFHDQMIARRAQDQQRADLRAREALSSSRWGVAPVLDKVVARLIEQGGDGWKGVRRWEQAAEQILWAIAVDGGRGKKVCDVLDRWRAWHERGGMNLEDLSAIKADVSSFCEAILLMAVLRLAADTEENALALDVHECMRAWKKVRVG